MRPRRSPPLKGLRRNSSKGRRKPPRRWTLVSLLVRKRKGNVPCDGVGPQQLAELEAVEEGHFHRRDDDVRRLGEGAVDGQGAVGGEVDLVLVLLQGLLHHLEDLHVVVDDEDGAPALVFHHPILCCSM